MKAPSGPISSAATFPTSSGVPARFAGQTLDHAPVAGAARPRKLILGQRGHNDAGADLLIRAPRLPHRTASNITRSEFPRLES